MKKLIDMFGIRGEVVEITLKKKGKPVASIYSDDSREFVSPLMKKKEDDARPS